MKWYENQKLIRMWARLCIMLFFFMAFFYVILAHTGLKDGQIMPMTLYSFLSGILVSKVIDYYMGDEKSNVPGK